LRERGVREQVEQQVWIMFRDVGHLRLLLCSLEGTAMTEGVALIRFFAAGFKRFSFYVRGRNSTFLLEL
jgi:hypothetical protein